MPCHSGGVFFCLLGKGDVLQFYDPDETGPCSIFRRENVILTPLIHIPLSNLRRNRRPILGANTIGLRPVCIRIQLYRHPGQVGVPSGPRHPRNFLWTSFLISN